jgi:hypothetical protein
LNSGVYRIVFFVIVNSSESNSEVSTKAGQLQRKGNALGRRHLPAREGIFAFEDCRDPIRLLAGTRRDRVDHYGDAFRWRL